MAISTLNNHQKPSHSSLKKKSQSGQIFFVILKGIGIIAIDVKGKDANFERYGKKCFTLDEELEVRRYFSFEQLTRIPVWFVFIPPQQPSLQYWIPFLKVLECEKEVNKEGKEFRIVPVDKCIVLQTNRDKISRIIEQFIT